MGSLSDKFETPDAEGRWVIAITVGAILALAFLRRGFRGI